MEPSRDRRASPVGRLPRRRTDRVEDTAAWLLASIALFVLLLAIWGGAGVHADALDQSRLQHGQRRQVEAVLLNDPPPGYREVDSEEVTSRSVRFVDTSGSEHVADGLVCASSTSPISPTTPASASCSRPGSARPRRRRSPSTCARPRSTSCATTRVERTRRWLHPTERTRRSVGSGAVHGPAGSSHLVCAGSHEPGRGRARPGTTACASHTTLCDARSGVLTAPVRAAPVSRCCAAPPRCR